jgi:LAO/AO transport system kinase
MSLAERVLAGDRLALARLLSQIENENPDGLATLTALYSQTGRAHMVGITGAPGTGKSTLVNHLAQHIRQALPNEGTHAAEVAVVAVDPSSPFSGGAILGDRIRMRDLAGDPGIFIRSMASRGALGGVARATASVVQALDAAGFDWILIETVGAGQAEVDIARTAHTTIVVTAPGMGDEVQAIKAGILEIADILVVNKSDLPGAENTMRTLQAILGMAQPMKYVSSQSQTLDQASEDSIWDPPVLATIATQGEGVGELVRQIIDHREYLKKTGQWEIREQDRIRTEMDQLLRERLAENFLGRRKKQFDEVFSEVVERHLSPRQAIDQLLDESRS